MVNPKEQKTALLNLRLRPSIKAALLALADADGRSAAAWVEQAVLKAEREFHGHGHGKENPDR